MQQRLLAVVAFALVIALAASYLVYRQLEKRIRSGEPTQTTRILVAAHDLQIGTLIKEADVQLADWHDPAPAYAIRKADVAVGRGVMSMIYAGEPVHPQRLAPVGGGGGLASTIPIGKRAVAVRVNDVVGVAGFISPGTRVDVLVSGTPPNSTGNTGPETRTVLQNIEVLSAGQNIQKDAEGKPVAVQVVNMLVSPEQAERLSLASSDARIQLVLRNPMDTQETKTPGTALSEIFGGPVQAQVQRPVPRLNYEAAPAARKAAAPAKKAAAEEAPVPQIVVGSKKGAAK
jgi:pilus assembly protein CpaB